MLSIIICSRTEEINPLFLSNITETIDCAFELIIIDNSQNKYSIFEAYNVGINKSQGDYLCFIHDDIKFHTRGWGTVVESIFQSDKSIGLIGIAGAKVKTKMLSGWWDCPGQYRVINIIQHLGSGKTENWQIGWKDKSLEEVVAVDGVFMAIPKSDNVLFTEKFEGFHNYDLDISFKIKQNKRKIVVTNQILLEHHSEGQVDGKWLESTLKVHNFYSKILPLSIDEKMNADDFKNIDYDNFRKMIYLSYKYKRRSVALKIWLNFFLKNPTHNYHYTFWREFLKLR